MNNLIESHQLYRHMETLYILILKHTMYQQEYPVKQKIIYNNNCILNDSSLKSKNRLVIFLNVPIEVIETTI